jgi:hypothetical protein
MFEDVKLGQTPLIIVYAHRVKRCSDANHRVIICVQIGSMFAQILNDLQVTHDLSLHGRLLSGKCGVLGVLGILGVLVAHHTFCCRFYTF